MGKREKKSGYWVYQCLTNNTNKWNAVLSLFKILSLSISRFETRTRILFSKSRISRRERDFFLNISGFETRTRFFSQYLSVRDENEIFLSISQGSRRERDFFINISGFETRPIQVSCFEMGLWDEINLILTRIFEIEKSRHALLVL